MQKTGALLLGLTLFSYSVLAPLQANAATVLASVITSPTTTADVMTNPVSTVQEPSIALKTLSVTLTSYNAVAEQTSPTPWVTASGARSNSQVIAARSRDLANQLPYGTIIAVMGPSSDDNGPYCGYDSVSHLIGYRVIADSMAARMHNKVDVMFDADNTVPLGGRMVNPALVMGACTGVQVQVVGYINPQHIPKTQAALAAFVTSSQHLAFAKF
jgi:3D (Asp-Asp-Asp) domain-containing protein